MNSDRSPAIFISHGAPSELLGSGPWQFALESVGRELMPRAVIVMSAHYRAAGGFDVGFSPSFETIHDFSGFAKELYQFKYSPKGDRDLAQQCVDLLHGAAINSSLDTTRGIDHGVYVPLSHMWPKANIPVIPIAIHSKASPHQVFRVGEILAPLRSEGVVIVGSGGMVHNLGALEWQKPSLNRPEAWATRFQDWVIDTLRSRNFEALCDFKNTGPGARQAHPTWEHFAPLVFVAGAASAWEEDLTEIYSGWTHGSLSMMTLGFGKIFRDS